jgi:hypothetical protein
MEIDSSNDENNSTEQSTMQEDNDNENTIELDSTLNTPDYRFRKPLPNNDDEDDELALSQSEVQSRRSKDVVQIDLSVVELDGSEQPQPSKTSKLKKNYKNKARKTTTVTSNEDRIRRYKLNTEKAKRECRMIVFDSLNSPKSKTIWVLKEYLRLEAMDKKKVKINDKMQGVYAKVHSPYNVLIHRRYRNSRITMTVVSFFCNMWSHFSVVIPNSFCISYSYYYFKI